MVEAVTDQQHSIFNIVLAAFERNESGEHNLLGTAFAIGGGAFATAGHVAEAVKSAHSPRLWRRKNDGRIESIPISHVDISDSIDFGVLYADYSCAPVPWVGRTIPERIDVWSEGFGYGYDAKRKKLIARHLKGHIVSRQRYESWAEVDFGQTRYSAYPFVIYELSFSAPRGQSGSPLFVFDGKGGVAVVGIVTGNSKASTEELERIEVETDGAKEVRRYETYNYLSLGQAISTESLLTIKLQRLDKTLEEHLTGKIVSLTE